MEAKPEVKPLRLKCRDALNETMSKYWAQAKQAPEAGKLVAWCTAVFPVEFLVAADIYPVFPENHCAACGAAKVGGIHCEIAEAQGFSIDICSYARNDIGAVLAGEETKSPIGGMPKPDLLVACDNQCNTVVYWYENLSRHFNVPLIVLDVPKCHDWFTPDDKRAAIAYVTQQLQEAISVVEGLTGRPLNYDRLSEALAHTQKAAQLWQEVQEVCRHIPSPLTSFDHFIWLFPIVVLRGFPEGVTLLETLKAEAGERVAQGIGAIPEERFRLYWDNIAVWYKIRELFTRFAMHGGIPVAAAYPFVWNSFELSDPARPVESMAEAAFDIYLNRGIGQRVKFLSDLVDQYSIDGLVMQVSRTCKPFFMGQQVIIDDIERKLGVPGVIIEGDMVDPRVYFDAEVNGAIDAFMESLAARPPRRK